MESSAAVQFIMCSEFSVQQGTKVSQEMFMFWEEKCQKKFIEELTKILQVFGNQEIQSTEILGQGHKPFSEFEIFLLKSPLYIDSHKEKKERKLKEPTLLVIDSTSANFITRKNPSICKLPLLIDIPSEPIMQFEHQIFI